LKQSGILVLDGLAGVEIREDFGCGPMLVQATSVIDISLSPTGIVPVGLCISRENP
jgi:hypothetical protein